MTIGLSESGIGTVTAFPFFVCSVIVPAGFFGGAGGFGGSGFFTVYDGTVPLGFELDADDVAVAVSGATTTVLATATTGTGAGAGCLIAGGGVGFASTAAGAVFPHCQAGHLTAKRVKAVDRKGSRCRACWWHCGVRRGRANVQAEGGPSISTRAHRQS